MRTLAIAIAVVCSVGLDAGAETPADLTARGEQLAKDGRLTEGIDAFKGADQLEPRARHACLIALAYIRRELWSQAEIFLATCHERATAADPLPDWVPLADKQLGQRLAQATVAAVTFRVVPDAAATHAQVAVSSFAPDELFSPRTIHLAPGTHLLTITSPGRPTVQQTLVIEDATAREVVIDFTRRAPLAIPGSAAPPPERGAQPSRIVPTSLMVLGGAVTIVGATYHLLAFKATRDKLAAATDPAVYDQHSDDFDRRRIVTVALYGAGAAVLITGVVLQVTASGAREPRVRAAAQLVPRGMVVGLEWRR